MRKDYTPEYAAFPAPRRRLMRARPPNSPYGLRQWLHRALPGLLVPTGNQLSFYRIVFRIPLILTWILPTAGGEFWFTEFYFIGTHGNTSWPDCLCMSNGNANWFSVRTSRLAAPDGATVWGPLRAEFGDRARISRLWGVGKSVLFPLPYTKQSSVLFSFPIISISNKYK